MYKIIIFLHGTKKNRKNNVIVINNDVVDNNSNNNSASVMDVFKFNNKGCNMYI